MSTSSILWPDAFILLATVVAWINDMAWSEKSEKGRRMTYLMAVWAPLIAAVGYASLLVKGIGQHAFFDQMVVVDPFACAVKFCLSVGFSISLIYGRAYLQASGLFKGAFFLLALFALIGQLVMVSGNHFLILYLGLELMSLSLYSMVALQPEDKVISQAEGSLFLGSVRLPSEAALKYYVLGALASGFLLFGLSMIYGATGSLYLADVATHIKAYPSLIAVNGPFNAAAWAHIPMLSVLLCGLVFIVVGIAFKLGLAPFHMWVPDVYEGAPTPTTLLIGGIPKLAALAWGMRFLVIGFWPLADQWSWMLTALIVLSLLIGNAAGIVQSNIKRLLAYSAIAHAGFIALGLFAGGMHYALDGAYQAYGATFFYSVIYLITTLGAFGVILSLVEGTPSSSTHSAFSYHVVDHLDGIKGLSQRNPLLAAVMMMAMFSLAGIPPTAGFYAKLSILTQVVQTGWTGLAVFSVITSLWGAFYYLRIVKLMYFDAPSSATPFVLTSGMRFVLALNGAAILFLGLFPNRLLDWCTHAVLHTFGGA